MPNPTGKNQYTGKKVGGKSAADIAKAMTAKAKKPKNQVTVIGGQWTGPMNARVFVPNGKISKARGPSKYG